MLSAFQYYLQYIPGVQNVVADALMRQPLREEAHEIEDDEAMYKKLDSLPVTV